MLTPEQIADRPNKIGASDAARICGFFGGDYDIWLEKTRRIEPFTGNEATRAGDLLEHAVITHAAKTLGAISLRTGVEVASAVYPFITATLDAIPDLPTGDPCIIEAKTGGICSPLSDEWGEPETDEIPEHYMIQVQHQMFAAGPEYQFVALSALIPPRGFCMYYIPRDEALIEAIVERELKFWEHVKSDTPPDGTPSMDALKRMRRTPKKTVEIDPSLLEMYREAQEKAKASEKEVDEAKSLLLAALGDAEAGDAGSEMVTYYESSRKGYVVEPTTYRQLRIKKVK